MEKRRRVAVYGSSLNMAGIVASLTADSTLEVLRVSPDSPIDWQRSDENNLTAIVFDMSDPSLKLDVAVMRNRPGLLLIGVDPSKDEIQILFSRPVQALSIADLTKVIHPNETIVEKVDADLANWVKETLGKDITISLLPPDKAPEGQGISLYLLSLAENPPLQGTQRAPLQFWRRYLVTTWAEDPSQAHALLGKLLLKAMETPMPNSEVELDNIHPAIWSAFGIPPRPAFILRVQVRKERAQSPAQLVREPLHVKWIKRLNGALYGPKDSPLPGVRVALMPEAGDNPIALEYARLYPSTVTDAHGSFSFASVPDQTVFTLYIQHKDQELFISLDRPTPDNTPVILRLDLLALQVTGPEDQPAASGLVRFTGEGSATPELRLEYPVLQLATQLNTQGQGYLLLQEKALGQAGQWLPGLQGKLLSADQQPLAGARVVCPSLKLSATTNEEGDFSLK